MRAAMPGLTGCLTALLAVACGGGRTPTSPTTASDMNRAAPVGAVPSGHVRVTDGWTGGPVADLRVWLGDVLQPVDPEGRVAVDAPGCTAARFVAPGYLERVVLCVQQLVQGEGGATLWPVGTAMEAEATREAVFWSGPGRLVSLYPNDFYVEPELAARTDVFAAWTAANARLLTATAGTVRASFLQQPPTDDGYVIGIAAGPSACTHTWFSWTLAAAGFCWGPTPSYFVQRIAVDAQRSSDPSVALRAMLYGMGIRQHRMPGLFNATAPADDLSEFERRTIHMAQQRRKLTNFPGSIRWPDIECAASDRTC